MARKGYLTASFTLPDGKRKYVYARTQEELDEKVFQLKMQLYLTFQMIRSNTQYQQNLVEKQLLIH